MPDTFDDDYKNRASVVADFKMKIAEDMTYHDLDLIETAESPGRRSAGSRAVPQPNHLEGFELRCRITGERYTFETPEDLKHFKYQRYMRKYLQTVHSIDENVGRMLDYLDQHGLAENTIVIYSSDQGFYLGEHGWFDKRLIYEQSFQMPFLIRYPREIEAGIINRDMTCNVDFAPTWLDYADCTIPNYMQGRSIRANLQGNTPEDWTDLAYHRYWMNADSSHHVCAHYGIRTERYKLIYWYNEDLGQHGAFPGDGRKEWELFDLEEDPLELFNVYRELKYQEVVQEMRTKLDREMERIGDVPEH